MIKTRFSFFVAGLVVTAVVAPTHGQGRGGGQAPVAGQSLPLGDVVCMGLLAGGRTNTNALRRGITKVRGNLYHVQVNRHATVFLVTPAGAILADPINVETATWLKQEIAERFKVPVRYVVYSHSHWDHAAGARCSVILRSSGATQ